MKKLLIVLALCLTCHALLAQDLIKPINGKSFFADIQSIENGIVNYQIGISKMTMPTTEIALIEFKEGGVQYFHTESLKEIDPKNDAPVWKRGHKVYIPFSSNDVTQRSGALKLRELVGQNGFWEVADCKEEAHFILDFMYSEEGLDHANVMLKEKNGNSIVQTPKVNNSGRDPKIKGEMLAKAQYDEYIGRMASGRLEFEKGHIFLSGRRNAFVIRPEITVGWGFNSGCVLGSPTLTIGYQFNPYFFLGTGSGWSYIPNSDYGHGKNLMSIPIYGNLRVYMGDKPCSAFFDLKAGYNYPLNDWARKDYYYKRYFYDYSLKGVNGSITFGWQAKHFDFGLTAGVFHISEKYYEPGVTNPELLPFLEGNHVYYNDKWNIFAGINMGYNIQIRKRSSY